MQPQHQRTRAQCQLKQPHTFLLLQDSGQPILITRLMGEDCSSYFFQQDLQQLNVTSYDKKKKLSSWILIYLLLSNMVSLICSFGNGIISGFARINFLHYYKFESQIRYLYCFIFTVCLVL